MTPLTRHRISRTFMRHAGPYDDGREVVSIDRDLQEIDKQFAGRKVGALTVGFTCRPDRPRPAQPIDDPLAFTSTRELVAHYRATRARITRSAAAREPEGEAPGRPLSLSPPEPGLIRVLEFGPRLVYSHVALVGPTQPLRRPIGIPRRYADIILEVADRHGVSVAALRGVGRRAAFVRARQEAMFLLKTRCALSLNAIGRLIGGRDHSTVFYGIESHARRQRVASCPLRWP